MKNSIKLRALLFALVLAAGTVTSCKNKETTVDETTTETTVQTDTTAVPPVTEEIPGDTTTTGAPTGEATTPAK